MGRRSPTVPSEVERYGCLLDEGGEPPDPADDLLAFTFPGRGSGDATQLVRSAEGCFRSVGRCSSSLVRIS